MGKLRCCTERPPGGSTNLKVDVSIGEAGGAALVQEVDVLDEEAEERNHDLQGRGRNGGNEGVRGRRSVVVKTAPTEMETVSRPESKETQTIQELNRTNEQHLFEAQVGFCIWPARQ